ncbi:deoxycytidylate deaminase-like isoform X1 [Rhynchophorus ferrugineus]|uniref:deoxycytidylate deaminase-like isoform X1 n=1 Tax=Rhynchophorus ferrugineus TaxID=354439 RepID=UPI003FCC4A7F
MDSQGCSNHRRLCYLEGTNYFMGLACLTALRTFDRNNQVGVCVIDAGQKIVSLGYQNDSHAEINALNSLNSKSVSELYTMFVTKFPCSQCAYVIGTFGIKKLVYPHDKRKKIRTTNAFRILQEFGIDVEPYISNAGEIVLSLGPNN